MIDINNYKKLKQIPIKNKTPKSYFPNPKESDYTIGFITRYFTQQRDTPGSPIFELSQDSFYDYSNTPFWKGVKLNWKIKGALIDSYTQKGEFIPSVQTINRLAIQEAEKELSEINLYLVNLTQFHR
jgi:hypothetical protein